MDGVVGNIINYSLVYMALYDDYMHAHLPIGV